MLGHRTTHDRASSMSCQIGLVPDARGYSRERTCVTVARPECYMTSSRAFVLARERYLYRQGLDDLATAGRVLVYLADVASAAGDVPPVTYPQIMHGTGIRSRTTLVRALDRLVEKGLIIRQGTVRCRRYVILWPTAETWPSELESTQTRPQRRHLKAI